MTFLNIRLFSIAIFVLQAKFAEPKTALLIIDVQVSLHFFCRLYKEAPNE